MITPVKLKINRIYNTQLHRSSLYPISIKIVNSVKVPLLAICKSKKFTGYLG